MAVHLPPPSYSHHLASERRSRNYPIAYPMFDKLSNRRLMRALGVPLPRRFSVHGSSDEVVPRALAEPTVIKPVRGSNSRGVFQLLPDGQDRWFDVGFQRTVDHAELRELMAVAVVEDELPDEWISEELVLAPENPRLPPLDLKVLVFGHRIGAYFVKDHLPYRFSWFDGEGRPIDSGIPDHIPDRSISVPGDLQRYLDLAIRVGRRIPIPHIRVDFIVGDRGPVLGELTPYPGWGHRLHPELDARLGALYEEAERELLGPRLTRSPSFRGGRLSRVTKRAMRSYTRIY